MIGVVNRYAGGSGQKARKRHMDDAPRTRNGHCPEADAARYGAFHRFHATVPMPITGTMIDRVAIESVARSQFHISNNVPLS